jgi:hypothetical protein
MGNLGGYQTVTTVIKSLGGPGKAAFVVLGGVFVAGGVAHAGGQKVVNAVSAAIKKRNVPCATKGQVFEVVSAGKDSSGLKFRAGDEYRVLECDKDAILIEVLGNAGNPYFVSGEFLATISDFPAEDPTTRK